MFRSYGISVVSVSASTSMVFLRSVQTNQLQPDLFCLVTVASRCPCLWVKVILVRDQNRVVHHADDGQTQLDGVGDDAHWSVVDDGG